MNTGTKCCEHYPEGLPVCSECREESTLAHDKACAALAEARAEIERLKDILYARGQELTELDNKYHAERESDGKVIGQMREALKGASKHFDRNYWNVKNDPDFEDLNEIWSNIEAALAAEMGE